MQVAKRRTSAARRWDIC